jgi:hypothetical protein
MRRFSRSARHLAASRQHSGPVGAPVVCLGSLSKRVVTHMHCRGSFISRGVNPSSTAKSRSRSLISSSFASTWMSYSSRDSAASAARCGSCKLNHVATIPVNATASRTPGVTGPLQHVGGFLAKPQNGNSQKENAPNSVGSPGAPSRSLESVRQIRRDTQEPAHQYQRESVYRLVAASYVTLRPT